MTKFIVEIDKNTCQGFGACEELCPKFFHVSDTDGKSSFERVKEAKKVSKGSEVVAETLELDDLECARQAADACPYNAIHITNTESGEKLI